MKKVILAYSGGLDTSVILKWLQQEKNYDVITFTADIGQQEDLKGVTEKALAHGATDAVLADLTAKFAAEYVNPMLRASATYEGYYLLGTAISRPLIAKELTILAHQFHAAAIVHGATGKGNDQVRFELSAYALDPDSEVIAPWREWSFRGRAELEKYAQRHGITVPTTSKDPWSHDANLLHSSYEGGILEDPWQEPPEHLFRLTRAIAETPDESEYIEIEFKNGDAVSTNGEHGTPEQILHRLNKIAGIHGIGRVDLVENRVVGIKSRGVYETPGGTLLYHARRAVESITIDRETLHQRDQLSVKYAELVYNGYWFSPEREALQVYMDYVAKAVSGVARLKLLKGNCWVVGRRSHNSLYNTELATFEADAVFNQADAAGFIKINSLRLRMQAQAKQMVRR